MFCCILRSRCMEPMHEEIFFPKELLVQILRLLPFRQNASSCRLVCKHWKEAVEEVLSPSPHDYVFTNPAGIKYNKRLITLSETWLLFTKYDSFTRKWAVKIVSDKERNAVFRFPNLRTFACENSYLLEITSKRGFIFCLFGTSKQIQETDGTVHTILVLNPITGHVQKLDPPMHYGVYYWERRIGTAPFGLSRELNRRNMMNIEFEDSCYCIIFKCDPNDLPTGIVVYDSAKQSWKEVMVRAHMGSADMDFSKVVHGTFFFIYPILTFDDTTYYFLLVLAYNVAQDTWSKVAVKKMDCAYNIQRSVEIHKYNGRLLACIIDLEYDRVPPPPKRTPCRRRNDDERKPMYTQWKVCEILPSSSDFAILVDLACFPFPTPLVRYPKGRASPVVFASDHLICFSWMLSSFRKNIQYKYFKDFVRHGEHRIPPTVYDISQNKWDILFDERGLKKWLRLDHQEYDCTSLFSPWQSIT